jgi:L-asparaginase / beta-aspartyl-peptidase
LVKGIVIAHGGAGSVQAHVDGTEAACRAAMAVLRKGGSPLESAVAGAVVLEDDPRFNAGTGSNLRLDGKTIEMDASCMTSDGKFGAVAGIRNVRNPILVAKEVHRTPHNLLVGEGATVYARRLGHAFHDPRTPAAEERYRAVRKALHMIQAQQAAEYEWDLASLAHHWNYEADLRAIMGPSDTIGVLATDGRTYAAACSTGGTSSTLLSRVGDVPVFGAGIYVGPTGAVAVTGDGDFLTRKLLSFRTYLDLEAGKPPQKAVDDAFTLFPPPVDVGVIILHKGGFAGGSNRQMAWAALEEDLG